MKTTTMKKKDNTYGSIPITNEMIVQEQQQEEQQEEQQEDQEQQELNENYNDDYYKQYQGDANVDYRYIESTAEIKRRKCLTAFVPVLIFIVLMGSIAFVLFHDFDTLLYPGHHSGGHSTTAAGGRDYVVHTSTDEKTDTTNTSSNTSSNTEDVHSTSATSAKDIQPQSQPHNTSSSTSTSTSTAASGTLADCSHYSKCELLGLTGLCCPTKEGVNLQCCN